MKAVFTRHRIRACLLAALLMLTTILPVAALDPGELDAKSALLMEAETGEVLYEMNADESLPPASVTKIMTLLLVMEAVDGGSISLEDNVSVSEKSCRNGRFSGLSLFGRADER